MSGTPCWANLTLFLLLLLFLLLRMGCSCSLRRLSLETGRFSWAPLAFSATSQGRELFRSWANQHPSSCNLRSFAFLKTLKSTVSWSQQPKLLLATVSLDSSFSFVISRLSETPSLFLAHPVPVSHICLPGTGKHLSCLCPPWCPLYGIWSC